MKPQKIDLSYYPHEGMFKYPSDPEVESVRTYADVESIEEYIYDGGGHGAGASSTIEKFKSGNLEFKVLRNHHGTHIDAPAHKLPNGKTIDKYPVDFFINDCMLVDLTAVNFREGGNSIICRKHLDEVLRKSTPHDVTALIFYTGFCEEMREKEGKLSLPQKKEFEKSFPYFYKDDLKYFLDNISYNNCRLNILGIDSFSVDPQGSNSEVHRMLFGNKNSGKDILPLETVFNLEELKNTLEREKRRDSNFSGIFKLVSVPLRYNGADAGQTPAYAVVGSSDDLISEGYLKW